MVTEYRLQKRSIPYQVVDKLSCPAPLYFSYPADARAAACPSAQRPDQR